MPVDDVASQTAMPAARPVVGRFAPSPTGDLHLGNALTALVAWARARQVGGAFIVRTEDLDAPRCVPGMADRILVDLERLGIDWDGPVLRQSDRTDEYQAAARTLADQGRLFGCLCSRKDLERAASAPAVDDEGPPYPGTCSAAGLALDDPRCAWRFRVNGGPLTFVDGLQGPQKQAVTAAGGDFVVRRKDGLFAYQLAVVVDDAAQGVTEVVRGIDLLSSTPRQLQLYQALGLTPPTFAHVPLLLDGDGHKLSKRRGTQPTHLRALWASGMTTERMIAQLARAIGVADVGESLSAIEFMHALPRAMALGSQGVRVPSLKGD